MERQQDEGQERQFPAQGDHQDKRAEKPDDPVEQSQGGVHRKALHFRDIAIDPGHQIAGPGFGEIVRREPLQVAIDVGAQRKQNAARSGDVVPPVEAAQNRARKTRRQHRTADGEDHREIARKQSVIDQELSEVGLGQRQQACGERDREHRGKPQPVRPQKPEQPAVDLRVRLGTGSTALS